MPEVTVRTRCEHCNTCGLKPKCTKAKNGRTMEIDHVLEAQKSKVRALLSSDDGKSIMKNRSIQSEGAFGILKEDYGFHCLSRRGESGVMVEVYYASIGFNIRKYHKVKLKKEEARERLEQEEMLKKSKTPVIH